MKQIKCECGEIIVEGDIATGKKRQIFVMKEKPKGEIRNNGSNNPTKWEGLCSKCQKEKYKKKKKQQ